jgi:hypothetical protein
MTLPRPITPRRDSIGSAAFRRLRSWSLVLDYVPLGKFLFSSLHLAPNSTVSRQARNEERHENARGGFAFDTRLEPRPGRDMPK